MKHTSPPAPRGLTLIELLVVVMLLAVLISMLLPGVSAARRNGRITRCLTNQKQHAQAAAHFASQNNDRLPHGPEGPSTDPSHPIGVRGRPARFMAIGDGIFPTNGWGFSPPSQSADQPLGLSTFSHINPADSLRPDLPHSSMYDFYLPTLGPYIVDGEGTGMLQDVFVCPSQTQRIRSWEHWRAYMIKHAGRLPSLESIRGDPEAASAMLVGSYRYSLAALVSAAIYSYGADGRPTSSNTRYSSLVLDSEFPREHVVFNHLSDVSHPDRKALFFLHDAAHDRQASLWMEPGATCTLALADGGAKAIKPAADAARPTPAEHAGPKYARFPERFVHSQGAPGELAYFFATHGGIRGRDLQ